MSSTEVLRYKKEPTEELVEIKLTMSCKYMFKYQGLIEEFVSSFDVIYKFSSF
jgi:hypothetical protein